MQTAALKKRSKSLDFFDGLKVKSKGYVDAKLTSWENEGKSGKEIYRKRIKI